MKKHILYVLLVISIKFNAQCFNSVNSGLHHNIALHSNGTIYSWGDDSDGALGLVNSNSVIYYPTQINTEKDWEKVFAGGNSSFAIKKNGTLWVWGENRFGQLGTGDQNGVFIPTQLNSDNDWEYIVASTTTIAKKTNGTIWGWGNNNSGQLGIGDTSSVLNPIQISNETDWKMFVPCGLHTLAIKNDGTLWATGKNIDGSLGDGTDVSKLNFIQIGTDNNWVQVTGGTEYSLGLKSDGTIWGWGRNYVPFQTFTIFGDQYPSRILTPISLSGDNNWVQISGKSHLVGIKSDGTLWNIKENTQIGTDTDWDIIYGGFGFFLISKKDGSLWSYGSNNFGQLGVGSEIQNTTTPLKIDCSTLKAENLSLNKVIEIYPNPTSQKIFIKNKINKSLKLCLTDLNGKILFESKRNISEINLEGFSKGIYILNVETEKGKEIFKIMKE